MNINTKNLVSITDANQNFSKVARLVERFCHHIKEQRSPVSGHGIQCR